jgi:hypothetical protein
VQSSFCSIEFVSTSFLIHLSADSEGIGEVLAPELIVSMPPSAVRSTR